MSDEPKKKAPIVVKQERIEELEAEVANLRDDIVLRSERIQELEAENLALIGERDILTAELAAWKEKLPLAEPRVKAAIGDKPFAHVLQMTYEEAQERLVEINSALDSDSAKAAENERIRAFNKGRPTEHRMALKETMLPGDRTNMKMERNAIYKAFPDLAPRPQQS